MFVPVSEVSQIGEARRVATAMAEQLGFDSEDLGRVALVAAEMGSNLVKHAAEGSILINTFLDADGSGVELLACDRGPGMTDAARCWQDGYSTAGSQGTGLGAISRLADRHDVYSRPGAGTVLMARLRQRNRPIGSSHPKVNLGTIVVPYPGETSCGDAWSFNADSGETLLLVDGLGHGPLAGAAALIATETFNAAPASDCVSKAGDIHRALAATRGAAIAIARIDWRKQLVRYVGIGNIAGAFVSDEKLCRMVSHNGTAGHATPRIAEFTYPFTAAPLLIMHTDGLSARWELNSYAGLASRHPSIIAGVLFRDHARGRDDACIVVLRVLHG